MLSLANNIVSYYIIGPKYMLLVQDFYYVIGQSLRLSHFQEGKFIMLSALVTLLVVITISVSTSPKWEGHDPGGGASTALLLLALTNQT